MEFTFTEKFEEGEILVEYRILKGEKYQIAGREIFKNKVVENISPELFYSEEETKCWCRYLCENKVLPSSLNYVLRDELYI
ncbi:MAG: hypothetical protein IKC07_05650 [Clostridia bacterium]|nr:hypothetical protein [Clostridia bacterium]